MKLEDLDAQFLSSAYGARLAGVPDARQDFHHAKAEWL